MIIMPNPNPNPNPKPQQNRLGYYWILNET